MLSKFFVVIALTIPGWSAPAATHCDVGEITYFSCKIKNSAEIASLCGSPFKDAITYELIPEAWLQYRFGKFGKLEFVYPIGKAGSISMFEGEYRRFYPESSSSVMFVNDGVRYRLEISGSFKGLRVLDKEFTCQDKAEVQFAEGRNNFIELADTLERIRNR